MLGLACVLSLLLGQALAIATISAKGSKLFTSDGEQFFIKGVAYQLVEDDTLVNGPQCQKDAALMKTLGANSIRVYHIIEGKDHAQCMNAFLEAGIYVWLDLDTQDTYILNDGSNNPQWTQTMYTRYQAVMDEFQAYDNLAGFFVGNEMLMTGADSIAAPYVKAAARDMKKYRDQKGYRPIPVGYSAADVQVLRPNLQNYLACGNDPADAVDFYSLNVYEWCGDSSYTTSGYDQLEKNATGYSVPIFFSEDGCNVPEPRTFDDQQAVLGPEMDQTWSGAIIYQWIQVDNNYGLVTMAQGSNVQGGYARYGNPTPRQPDFNNLKANWARVNPAAVQEAVYRPTNSAPACPQFTRGAWLVNGDVPLPTIGQKDSYLRTMSMKASASLEKISGPLKHQPKQTAAGGGKGASSSGGAKSSAAASPSSNDAQSAINVGGLLPVMNWFNFVATHNYPVFWLFIIGFSVLASAIVL